MRCRSAPLGTVLRVFHGRPHHHFTPPPLVSKFVRPRLSKPRATSRAGHARTMPARGARLRVPGSDLAGGCGVATAQHPRRRRRHLLRTPLGCARRTGGVRSGRTSIGSAVGSARGSSDPTPAARDARPPRRDSHAFHPIAVKVFTQCDSARHARGGPGACVADTGAASHASAAPCSRAPARRRSREVTRRCAGVARARAARRLPLAVSLARAHRSSAASHAGRVRFSHPVSVTRTSSSMRIPPHGASASTSGQSTACASEPARTASSSIGMK